MMMKRFLARVLACVTVAFTGCSSVKKITIVDKDEPVLSDSRFVYTSDYRVGDKFRIIRDVETNVLYILYINGYRGALSPLYDADGNVMVYEED